MAFSTYERFSCTTYSIKEKAPWTNIMWTHAGNNFIVYISLILIKLLSEDSSRRCHISRTRKLVYSIFFNIILMYHILTFNYQMYTSMKKTLWSLTTMVRFVMERNECKLHEYNTSNCILNRTIVYNEHNVFFMDVYIW